MPSRTSASSETNRTLLGRYIYSPCSTPLGKGAFGEVYKGLDHVDCVNVAIKIFKEDFFDVFAKAVGIYESIFLQGQMLGDDMWNRQASCDNSLVRTTISSDLNFKDAATIMELIEHLDICKCMVKLLNFSRGPNGKAGIDEDSGLTFMIFELGEMSLRDQLDEYIADGHGSMPADEVMELLWSLSCITWALHTIGFVHLDIKPENIMLFRSPEGQGQWKLIDVDGAVPTGSAVLPTVCYSPMYMSPELARCMLQLKTNRAKERTSRLMDVWSTGMVAIETVFLQPVLEPFYTQWQEETGSSTQFYEWLADDGNEAIVSGDMREFISAIDADLCSLLERMLCRDPQDRSCMAQCLIHPYFSRLRLGPKGKSSSFTPRGRLSLRRQVTESTSMQRTESTKEAVTKICAVM